MPNWCFNFTTFICPSKEIYDKLLESIQNNNWFETFAPLYLDSEKYENGWDYDKALEIWHTKWSPQDVEISTQIVEENKIEITFETAWSPPIGVYSIMFKNFNIEVISHYEEEGCDFFGRCYFTNQEQIEESFCFPTDKKDLNETRNLIGIDSDLDNFMSSTWENLLERWEEEEEDDDDDDDENEDKDEEEEEEEDEEEADEDGIEEENYNFTIM
jgi:hypothetical protein